MVNERTSVWRRSLALSIIACVLCINAASFAVPARAAQDEDKKSDKKGKKGKKNKGSGPTEAGQPMIWQDRGDVTRLDLFHGIGGPERVPQPPFTFVKEDVSGTNPKVRVTDANGATWNVKFDEEVHSEVASSRFVYAAGYMVEESYFLSSGRIEGVSGLGRAKKFVQSNGSFSNGMFERRPDDVTRRGINWRWDDNPFRGTKELSGLIILLTMMNNWDAKTLNNNVLGMFADDQSTVHDWYVVADWGGTFGKMGDFISKSKWDLNAFNKQGFISGVSGNSLRLNYSGKLPGSLTSVPLDHARWFAGIIGQLTDQQIRDAFRAAGANELEMAGFSSRMRWKIDELKRAVGM